MKSVVKKEGCFLDRLQALSGVSVLVFLQLLSCTPNKTTPKIVTECVLPDDQTGTLIGRWPITPVPLAVYSGGAFSENEVNEIKAAVDTWNSFYESSKGFPLLSYQGELSTAKPTGDICNLSGIISGSSYTGAVMIYKYGSAWPHSSGVIALTSVCPTGAVAENGLRNIKMAIMELNYQNFFTTNKYPDLQSIMAHELGHLVGLNHSCEVGSTTEGIANCSSGASSDYLSALLFPVIQFPDNENGEIRRSLNSNDQGRANCVY